MDLTPDEIIAAYLAELERVHGKKFARAAIVEYQGSWFYVSHPTLKGNRYVVNPLTRPLRRRQLLEMIDQLRGESSG
jgi:hypothetical protein